MEEHAVEPIPQTLIADERIGGCEVPRVHFEVDTPENQPSDTSYQAVTAIFRVAFLMALGQSWYSFESNVPLRGFEWFISTSNVLPSCAKAPGYRNLFNDIPELRFVCGALGAVRKGLPVW